MDSSISSYRIKRNVSENYLMSYGVSRLLRDVLPFWTFSNFSMICCVSMLTSLICLKWTLMIFGTFSVMVLDHDDHSFDAKEAQDSLV